MLGIHARLADGTTRYITPSSSPAVNLVGKEVAIEADLDFIAHARTDDMPSWWNFPLVRESSQPE